MYDEQSIRRELADELGPGYPEKMRPNGEAIRRLRSNRKVTQKRMAEWVGIDPSRVSHIESGGADSIYTEYLFVWMKALKCEHITELGSFLAPWPPPDGASIPPALNADSLEAAAAVSPPVQITREQITSLQPLLLEVDRIITLIHPESTTSLRDIYYRTLLLDESISRKPATPRVRFQIDALSDLKQAACVVLGTAGQGKSILLRHLTIQEALRAETLPLFFEFRKLGPGPLKEAILKPLRNWKVASTLQELEQLLEEGRIALLLDAFDELSIERRQDFLKELSDLHDEYRQLRIVVSARPDSGVQDASWLHPYSIQPLDFTDVESLIRIYAAEDDAAEVIARIHDADIKVKELLRSPLFVVLLIIRFEYLRQVPHTIIAFYADLFDALVRRHNKDVGGLKREVSSRLGTRQLEKAFQLICFQWHKQFGDQPVRLRTVEEFAERFSNRVALEEAAPARIVDDIIRITNLMLEEAGMCDFIHRTVKEHHAAAYIAENATDDQAQAFYAHLQRDWRGWRGVLWFLEQLDRIRYLRFFAIPELQRFAPYRASDVARSFRSVKITKDGGETFQCRFPLSETECYALTRQKQFSLFAACNRIELERLLGSEDAQRISDALTTSGEVVVDWKSNQQRPDSAGWEGSPIIHRLWNQNSERELHARVTAWEQEVQTASAPDADFEIG